MKKIFDDPVAVLVLVLGFGYLFADHFIPTQRTDSTGTTIGVISFMGIVLNYRYGSSKGSAKKDETINSALSDKNPVVNKAATVTVNQNQPE